MGGGLFLSQSLYIKNFLDKFAEFIGSKSTILNKSITCMDNMARRHSDSAVQFRFQQDRVAMAKG